MVRGYKVVLTADETMMSDYAGYLFLGFLSCAPRKGFVPPCLLFKFIIKPVPFGPRGEALLAPHGLRRIEAALLEAGVVEEDELITVHPKMLKGVVGENTQVILVSAVDPLGMGPASTTFAGPWGVRHYEPLNKWRFRELVCSDVIQAARRRGAVLMVGGPGAWQVTEDVMYDYGIDIVIVGEGEKIVPELISEILNGWRPSKPMKIVVPQDKVPRASEIPILRGATIGGLVEVSRGCGRGCKFCSPTLRALRNRRLEDILKDVEVNVKFGKCNICLHAEDILQYGGTPFRKKPEAVIKLFSRVRKVPGVRRVGVSHISLASIAEMPELVEKISYIIGLTERCWMGYQTGIETGSVRLVKELMRYKPYPFRPEDWPDVVEQAFGISVDNYMIPCATLILNLPGETEDDVLKTVELVDRLRGYKSFIVPLLFVPFTEVPGCRPRRLIEDATPAYWELFRAIWEHDVKWMKILAKEYSVGMPLGAKMLLKLIVDTVTTIADRKVRKFIDKKVIEARAISCKVSS
ncbi:MAG: radical SAM protein [Thermoprotei archaeon]|nr:MAG: radical SAM protein [Thermoprotei archaeon]